MAGKKTCKINVVHKSEAKGENRDHKISGRCVSFEKVPVVRTRLFYNSKMSKRDVEGLIARGNKTRFLRTGNMTSGHKFSRNNGPRDVGKCNSRVVTDECMVYNKTPLTLTPPTSDKKVRVEKQGGLLPRVTPVAGNIVSGPQGVFTGIVANTNKPSNTVSLNGDMDENNENKVLLFDINNNDDKFWNVTGKRS